MGCGGSSGTPAQEAPPLRGAKSEVMQKDAVADAAAKAHAKESSTTTGKSKSSSSKPSGGTAAKTDNNADEGESGGIHDDPNFAAYHKVSASRVSQQSGLAPPGRGSGRRRTSVSAESFNPNAAPGEKIVHPKNPEQMARIVETTSGNFLFSGLSRSEKQDVYNAMVEKKVPKNVNLIQQGEPGDFFYVVDAGEFDVYVQVGDADPLKVMTAKAGMSFGELALMYNAPRAATCKAAVDSVVWALDRKTFQQAVMGSMARKKIKYAEFLDNVEILSSLDPQEKVRVADCLASVDFDDGDVIIKQGDAGENFFLIEKGMVSIKQEKEGKELELDKLREGAYFGEIALINDMPRAATVVAEGEVVCATLDRGAFIRLLGPVKDILGRNMEAYKTFEQTLAARGVDLGEPSLSSDAEDYSDDDRAPGSGSESRDSNDKGKGSA